jgi:hypothetical protein
MRCEDFIFWSTALGLGAVNLTGFAMLIWNATAAQFRAKSAATGKNDVWEKVVVDARAEAPADTCSPLFVLVREDKILKGFAAPEAKAQAVEFLGLSE